MPRELLTMRIDPGVRMRLGEAAHRRRLSTSAVVRLAIDAWLAAEDEGAAARPYEEVADLLGRVDVRWPRAARRTARRRPGQRGVR